MKRSLFSATTTPHITLFWIWAGSSPLPRAYQDNINKTIQDYQSKPHANNTRFELLIEEQITISTSQIHPSLSIICINALLSEQNKNSSSPAHRHIVKEFHENKCDLKNLPAYDIAVMFSDLLRVFYSDYLHKKNVSHFTLYLDTDLQVSFTHPLTLQQHTAIISQAEQHQDIDILGTNSKEGLRFIQSLAHYQVQRYHHYFETEGSSLMLRHDFFNPIGTEQTEGITLPASCLRAQKTLFNHPSQSIVIQSASSPSVKRARGIK